MSNILNDDDDLLLLLLLDSADDIVDTSKTNRTYQTGKTNTDKKTLIDSTSTITVTDSAQNEYKYNIVHNTKLPSIKSFSNGYCQFFKQVSTTDGFSAFNDEGTNVSEYTVSSGDKTTDFKMIETDANKSPNSYAISVDLNEKTTVYISKQNKIGFTHEKKE